MTAITYFSGPALGPGMHFECTKLRGSASVEWCARQWREVNQQSEGRRHPRWVSCWGCAIGAEHAGFGAKDLPPALSEMRVCARCERECNRIIGGHLCVSCYNRQREHRIGRNRRGTAPIMHPILRDIRLRVYDPSRSSQAEIRVIPDCTSIREAMLRVFQKAGPGVAVSPCPQAPTPAQGGGS